MTRLRYLSPQDLSRAIPQLSRLTTPPSLRLPPLTALRDKFLPPSRHNHSFSLPALTNDPPSPPSIDDISRIIARLPNRRATGPDSIPNEVFKSACVESARFLHHFFSVFFTTAETPTQWSEGRIFPLYKGKGPRLSANSYRPITLLNSSRKLFELCLMPHLQFSIDLCQYQFGFRVARSTAEPVILLDDYLFRCPSAAVAFLDIKAAYDTVSRNLLFSKLLTTDAHPLVVALVASLYSNASSSIITSNGPSCPFASTQGVQQGSILSPLLYAFYIDSIHELLSPSLSNRCFLAMYADDIVIAAPTIEELNHLLSLCHLHSVEHGYEFSLTKSVSFTSGAVLDNQELSVVSSFNYLGVPFTQRGLDSASLISTACHSVAPCAHAIRHSIRSRHLPLSIVTPLFKTFVRPTIEYMIQILVPSPQQHRAINNATRLSIAVLGSLPYRCDADLLFGLFAVENSQLRTTSLRHGYLSKLVSDEDHPLYSFAPESDRPRLLEALFSDHTIGSFNSDITPLIRQFPNERVSDIRRMVFLSRWKDRARLVSPWLAPWTEVRSKWSPSPALKIRSFRRAISVFLQDSLSSSAPDKDELCAFLVSCEVNHST